MNRTVKLLSDVESLMPERIKIETKFIERLVGAKKENVESVFRQINEDNFKKVYKIIDFLVEIRPLEVESLLTLVSRISSKFGVDNLPRSLNYFRSLIAQGREAFTEFTIGSIERAIREDNVEQFCDLISDQSFNAKNRVNFSSVNSCDSMMKECKSYMQLIAYFGAINCFRQAIMNNIFDLEGISKYAISDGSNEIVRKTVLCLKLSTTEWICATGY